jgi:cytochrome c5
MTAVLLAGLHPGGVSRAQSRRQAKRTKTSAQQEDGEKKFQQNCSRCHNAPESLSPSIAGTVVRHMRVRASLSKQDAEAILHFLNP